MHQKGYAHRDLKLDNILMETTTKTIKIIDFGFSLKASGDEKLNVFCGTPHYMDPDIVRKSPYNGPAADIWACGVILYIIFVGKLPFFGEFEADLFRKIQNGKFTSIPADLGDEKIRHLFKRIFEVNSSTRITAHQVSTLLCWHYCDSFSTIRGWKTLPSTAIKNLNSFKIKSSSNPTQQSMQFES